MRVAAGAMQYKRMIVHHESGGSRGWGSCFRAPPRLKEKVMLYVTTLLISAAALTRGAPCEDLRYKSVSWRGVSVFSVSDLERSAGVSREGVLTVSEADSATKAVVDYYRSEGYLEASARLSSILDEDGTLLVIEVDEGRRYVVGDVSFDGVTCFSRKEVLEMCAGLRSGAAFTRPGLERSFDVLLKAYGEIGRAECRVSPRSFSLESGASVDFTIQVDEGRRCVIEEMRVTGGKTRAATAAKVAGLELGEPFNPWTLSDAKMKLARSGLFSFVGEPRAKTGGADSLVVIEVPVEEPPASSASGLLGYSGREGGAVGFVDLDLGNIMGTGRSGSFRWEASGGGLSSYGAGYEEPWLAGLPLSVKLGIEHLAQDTTYSTTGVSADLLLAAGRGFTFSLGVGRERTALTGVLPGTTTKRSRLALRAGARIDLRDNPVDPRNGLLLRADGDWGSRRDGGVGIGADKSVDLARLHIGSEVYRPVRGRHGVFLGVRWSKMVSDESSVPVDQLLRFGGAGSLRGYREDQFRAEETRLVQIEHRIALGERGSRLFLFTDLGMLRGEKAPDGTLIGYGLGLRAATRGGVVGLDFALGRGDSWREAKVHVKLERFF